MGKALTELLGTTIEKIHGACNVRKLQPLRQGCQELLENLDELLSDGRPAHPGVVVAADVALEPPSGTGTPPAELSLGESQKSENERNETGNDATTTSQKPEQALDSEKHSEDVINESTDKSDQDTVVEHSDEQLESVVDKGDVNQGEKSEMENGEGGEVDGGLEEPDILTESAAIKIFPIFQQALDTNRPNVMEIVVDCFQRLVAHRHLQGVVTAVATSLKSNPGRDPMPDMEEESEVGGAVDGSRVAYQGQVIDMICRCDKVQDDGVELKVLKALLTCVTSTTFCVHGQGLLLAVRTCYNIYLMSRSQVNQTTAKASLTQMLNVVFQRMEANSQHVAVSPIIVSDLLGLPAAASRDTESISGFVQGFLNKVVSDTLFAPSYDDVRQSVAGAFERQNVEGESSDAESEADHIEWKGEVDVSHSKVKNAEQLPMSPVIEASTTSTTKSITQKDKGDLRGEVLQRDAFLVFRALCKLSICTPLEAAVSEATAIRGKVLPLELLKVLLENSGPIFRSSERFIGAIKRHLCHHSLLKNCASSIPKVLSLSCSIFMTLVSKFRESLKAEIAVFYPMILLKPIEPPIGAPSPNVTATQQSTNAATTSYAQQVVVLRCLEAHCMDGQLLVDLFVNYDCDLENSNLFERTIMALVRKAQGSGHGPDSDKAQQQEAVIRQIALRSLVNVLWALVEWYQNNGMNAEEVSRKETTDWDSDMEGELDSSLGRTSRSRGVDLSGVDSPRRASYPQLADADETLTGTLSDTAKGKELQQKREYKTRFQKGLTLFNKHPVKGIDFLIREEMVGDDPEDIAQFLAKTEGLDKTMIGEYLGSREEACLRVMHAYVDALDFAEMELDVALRAFLAGFRLPGEAQKIDRLMEKFAERYVKCNPGAFKSADVAYVLSYSMIMLNTDAHNEQVKNKMTKEDFVRNNRGINDDMDLPEEYLNGIYERIVANEIKMRDDSLLDGGALTLAKNKEGTAWLDVFLSLIPGRRQAKFDEPNEEAIKRTQEYLREKAKGVTFFKSMERDTVRPLLEVAWAPMLGAFSVLFEQYDDQNVVALCLEGFEASVNVTARLGMAMLRNTFISSLCRFTHLHVPSTMRVKNALAVKTLLDICETVGDHLQENWVEVLRCVSQWEYLYQAHAGGPTDASLFAPVTESRIEEPQGTAERLKMKFRQLSRIGSELPAPVAPPPAPSPKLQTAPVDSFTEVMLKTQNSIKGEPTGPSPQVMLAVDIQDINRLFVNSELLGSEAIVEFVKALCTVSQDELGSLQAPRVFSLTKIVEIAHFNMGRIRLVWSRIWAILSDFFIQVGCQSNLQLAMYAVDSLRQLSMKFLERDELANYTFQNDFLKPFVVVMRQSKAVEIRELIIRCVSQMVLARVTNVKSGWKSMFMVFTTAAGDEQPTIVRLAFDTIEKIVREHFNYITETETTTFTDCVNCLIAFTNNPHSLDVALNSIAFLRFCAIKLAEGSIGDMEGIPEDASPATTAPTRIMPASSTTSEVASPLSTTSSLKLRRSGSVDIARSGSLGPKGIRFIDKDEHVYFWFPLLAGLSELTFDPRQEIRSSALEVLFDTLKFHGQSFAESFWARILDSVLLPIFDHVRAEVTDTTTFTDDKLRTQIDAWLYETCIKCLQHLVDLFLQFYGVLSPLIDRLFMLLSNFMRRPHQSLASMGVAALVRFINNAGEKMTKEVWTAAFDVFECTAGDTKPAVADLVAPPERLRRQKPSRDANGSEIPGSGTSMWTLKFGIGSRRLSEIRSRDAVQLLLVQAAGEIYTKHCQELDGDLMQQLLRSMEAISTHSRNVDSDMSLRQCLAVLQAEDKLHEDVRLMDPPLLRLESESSHAYLSILLHMSMGEAAEMKEACEVEKRLVDLCVANLERFEGREAFTSQATSSKSIPSPDSVARGRIVAQTSEGVPVVMSSIAAEYSMYSPLVVATLRALISFPEDMFKRHLRKFFPLLTNLIACEHAPLEVQKALSDVFANCIGPLIMV